MNTKKFQQLMLIIGILSAIFAGILSFKSESITSDGQIVRDRNGGGFGTGSGASIDTGADGGAMGFAVFAGLCFVAFSITTLKND